MKQIIALATFFVTAASADSLFDIIDKGNLITPIIGVIIMTMFFIIAIKVHDAYAIPAMRRRKVMNRINKESVEYYKKDRL